MTDRAARHPAKNSPDPARRTRQWLWRLASLLITAFLLIYLLGEISEADFGEVLRRVSAGSLFGAMLSYLILNLLRALRFRILLDKSDAPLRILIPITLYHNGLVRLLPFKLGELSYIVLLRSRLNYSMESGVSSLLSARLLELLIIVIVFATGTLLSGVQFADPQAETLLTAMMILIFIASVIGLYFGSSLLRALLRIIRPILSALTTSESRLTARLESQLLKIADQLEDIRNPRLFASALLISCFTYLSSFMVNYILLRAVGLEADLPTTIIIISIGMFGSALPFTPSGYGVVEWAWVIGLTGFAGYETAEAGTIGFILHGFQVITAALYGLGGYLLIRITPPLPASPQQKPKEQH